MSATLIDCDGNAVEPSDQAAVEENVRFMVDHVGSAAAFVLGGIVLELATGILLLIHFRRKQWL